MTWLRLQWRGALVVLAAWAGLAAAQSSGPQSSPYLPTLPAVPPPAANTQLPPVHSVKNMPTPATAQPTSVPAALLVTVNENGKSTRCRVVQTWVLHDGSTAHQLQAIDTGEFITILDDTSAPRTVGRGLPKRIFHWGLRNNVPPAGVPLPPQLVMDSGVVAHREINPPPAGATLVGASGSAVSPYSVGNPSVSGRVVSPSGGSTPAVAALPPCTPCGPDTGAAKSCGSCTGCLPDPAVIDCRSVVVDSRPTLREKLQGLFARKPSTTVVSQPSTVATTTVPPAKEKSVPRSQEKGLAITAPPSSAPPSSAPPSSAQPAQAQVVATPAQNDLARGTVKAATELAPGKPFLSMPTPVVPAGIGVSKPSVNTTTAVASAKPSDDNDILTAPEKFMPDAKRMKIKGLIAAPTAPATPVKEVEPRVIVTQPAVAPGVSTAGAAPVGLPPGAASIIAARNGLDGPVAYVPIQPVVVPKPWRAPLPPDPKLPEAPQLNTFVNAFSPPAPPRGTNAQTAMNGFGPMMPPMAPGYGMGMPMMPPYAMMNPYAIPPYAMMNPYQPQGMPYGYYPMPPTAMDAQRRYQGPLPPDPFHANTPPMVQPAGYMQPMAYPQYPVMQASYPQYPVMQAGYTAPGEAPTAAAPPAPAAQVSQLLDLLRNSAYPAQRELAAGYLASCDWRSNPQIVTALIDGAKQDPAPTVRAGCVTDLMRMGVATAAYRSMLDEMRTDADPRVRDAAEAALARMGPPQAN